MACRKEPEVIRIYIEMENKHTSDSLKHEWNGTSRKMRDAQDMQFLAAQIQVTN